MVTFSNQVLRTCNVARGPSCANPQHDLLNRASKLAAMGGWSCEISTQELTWTDSVFDIFGLDRGISLDRRETLEMYAPECRDVLETVRAKALNARSQFTLEASINRPDNERRWIRITAAPEVSDGRIIRLFGLKQDITQERAEWEALRELAYNDALTGLANRSCFQSDFLNQPAGSPLLEKVGALVIFDLDCFKSINDNWGHVAGDVCLATFAKRLLVHFPEAIMTARIGGDEFALVLSTASSKKAIEAKVKRVLRWLSEPFVWKDHSVPMSVSAGIAFADNPAQTVAEDLFILADTELYRAKSLRENDMADIVRIACH